MRKSLLKDNEKKQIKEEVTMNYDTALRAYPSKRLEEIESADILVGIPCYNFS